MKYIGSELTDFYYIHYNKMKIQLVDGHTYCELCENLEEKIDDLVLMPVALNLLNELETFRGFNILPK